MTDVKHMGVIGNLLIKYLSFFSIKRGSLRNGHNRKGGGGVRTKKRVLAAEHTCTGHILESPPPPPMSSRIYIYLLRF